MKEHKEVLSSNLRALLYIQIAAIAITLINAVSTLDNITQWVNKVLSIVAIRTLFQLKNVNPRYKSAAIAQLVVLVCGVLTTPVNSSAVGFSSILLLAGGVASWIASYQEYHGHGELVAEADELLAKKWNGLFLKEILIGLGISLISVIGTTALVATGTATGTVTTVIIVLSTLCGLALDGLYLHYMKQTLNLLEAEA